MEEEADYTVGTSSHFYNTYPIVSIVNNGRIFIRSLGITNIAIKKADLFSAVSIIKLFQVITFY